MRTIVVEPIADVHVHLREIGPVMEALIAMSVRGGADVLGPMPNTNEGLCIAEQVREYIDHARKRAPAETLDFMPIAMVTEQTRSLDIQLIRAAGIRHVKIYPRLRTTKSENGVENYWKLIDLINYCGELGIFCHFHPEHPWMKVGNRDAEYLFLPVAKMFLEATNATIVWEHGTDARCIPFWEEMAETGRFFVTLTAHHLATNEDDTFGDIRAVCKPPIKTESDRRSLVELVMRDHCWVMAGSDSAFHDVSKKYVETGCCSCGAFTAPFLMQLYAHTLQSLFDTKKGVEIFINFTSRNARRNFGLRLPTKKITLSRQPFRIPITYSIGDQTAACFWAGRTLAFRIAE